MTRDYPERRAGSEGKTSQTDKHFIIIMIQRESSFFVTEKNTFHHDIHTIIIARDHFLGNCGSLSPPPTMVITIIIIIGWEERIEYRMCAVHWAYLPTPLQPAYFVNRIWYFQSTRFTICLCIYYHHLFHIFHWNGYVPYTSYVRWILRERFPKKPKRNSYGKCHDFQRTWVRILLELVSNSLHWLTDSLGPSCIWQCFLEGLP